MSHLATASNLSKRNLILPAAIKLAILSIAYYILRHQSMLSGSFLWFLFQDSVGYIIVLGVQMYIIFQAIKTYFIAHPDRIKMRSGILIGVLSSVLGRLMSSVVLIILVNYIDLGLKESLNTISIVGIPFALIMASITGFIFGLLSSVILKLRMS